MINLLKYIYSNAINIKFIYRYLLELNRFINKGGIIHHFHPILHDYVNEAGTASGDYFHQDLLVANKIFKNNPKIHFDIGSRIDGFVAHVASFRKIYVFDVRNLKLTTHKNIIFKKISGEHLDTKLFPDSISCLHALEHFGLGRYGDPINPNAHIDALNTFTKILKKNGILYLSFPIKNKSEIYFNANRVFNLLSFMELSIIKNNYKLISLDYIDNNGDLFTNVSLTITSQIKKIGCGVLTLQKYS